MNRVVIGLLLCLSLVPSTRAGAQFLKTEYFKWTKTYYVDGSVKETSGESGQFVTRTRQICYDSDSEGCTIKNGTLTLTDDQGSVSKYVGPSYYGSPTSYTFFDDKGVLNIQDNEGNVYVYKKVTAPSGCKTSSLIASERNSSGSGSGGSVYVPPISTDMSSGGSSGSTKIRKTCAVCKGTGRTVKGSMAGIGKSRKYCSECGREVDSSHYHGMCSGCNGRGYTEY